VRRFNALNLELSGARLSYFEGGRPYKFSKPFANFSACHPLSRESSIENS
jgi:hypothetical protein